MPPASFAAPVWVHAVSLGRRAPRSLLQALLDRGLPVLLTHITATGRAEGERLFADAIARGQLRQAWLPYDFPGATRRFLARWRPRCGLLIEREIWPNLLAAARAQRVPMGLVSARYSESSLRQARRMGAVMREALAGLDLVLAQTPQDAERLRQAGAPQAVVTGSEIRPGAAAGARGRRTPVARGAGPAGRGGRQYARRRRCGFHRGDQARVGPAGRALVPADSPASAALRRSGGPAG